ncbi:lysophospholipid acyltransferase family protein [Leptospira sp. 96542]|nr:lysophospholipid acyltransferase family protein [Leptospira sp. 96542]
MKPKYHTVFYDSLIKLVSFSKGLIFHSIEENFSDGSNYMESDYPTAILSNHVSESDIVSLSMVYPRLNPRIKVIIPAREDILKPQFLQREFRNKGIIKWIFKIIDASNAIPFFLKYLGAVPIKRPFRDDSRELLKKGELRNKIDSEWEYLVSHIKKGRNLFMFPEGVYNQDGFLSQIKRGAYYIKSKIESMNFNSFTLTYDHLSYKKTKLYIKYGKPFKIRNEDSPDQVIRLITEKLGENYTVTVANLTSFILLKFEKESRLKKQQLTDILIKLKTNIESKFPNITLASELRKENFQTQLDRIFEKLKNLKMIHFENEFIITKDFLYQIPKSIHNLRKTNTVMYHKNQLTAHFNHLEIIWNEITKIEDKENRNVSTI